MDAQLCKGRMTMFLNLDIHNKEKDAMIDDNGYKITYEELLSFIDEQKKVIQSRSLIFILCENSVGAAAGYVACLANRIVPLMLSQSLDEQMLMMYIEKYHPQYLWVPSQLVNKFTFSVLWEKYGYSLLKTDLDQYPLYDDLSQLLVTSGSTGSPKLVRHSYKNVEANAQNVAKAFGLTSDERAMVSLPINFTQGLSTVGSNLYAGGTLLFSTAGLMQKEFWDFVKNHHATSFTGVPYSYEILDKLRFTRMNLPDLKIVNQGGGRLTDVMFQKLAEYAANTGKRFIATYGSTETTSRMAYLRPEWALKKCGSIGEPLPNGKIDLLDDDGKLITEAKQIGEIVYSGPNVTLGYGECGEDLIKGDERHGTYHTGDMAWRDEDGCYYIVGRKKRFLKLFGYRVSLDECERMLKKEFGPDCACVGTDKKLIVYTIYNDFKENMKKYLVQRTGINNAAFEIRVIDKIPKNDAGKTQYSQLKNI